MNPAISPTAKELPIAIYESILDGAAQSAFLNVPFKVETGEAERIAVDHVAQTTGADAALGSSCKFFVFRS
jgi:COP9 signalosome complex subunit 6